jgi:hypothetical protein
MRTTLLALSLTIFCGCASSSSGPGAQAPADDDAPSIQSNDIMAREPVADEARVKHILIAWDELADAFGGQLPERAAVRTRAQADELAVKLLERVRAGEDIEPIMKALSDDPGSAESGDAYEVTGEAAFVFEFKRMSLRLKVGEAGLVMSKFGWHIIKRVE